MCSGEYDNIWNKDYISVIKSKRRSIGIEVHMDGRVILRAPYTLSEKQLEEFVDKHKLWIEEKRRYLGSKARAGISTNAKKKDELTKDEIKCIKEAFENRVIYYSRIMGVTVKNITIKNQKTRWGSCTSRDTIRLSWRSCSSKGNLNFNYQLYYMPQELMDYVVVHELAHRKYMNHSKEFWAEVKKYCPEYKERKNVLKKYILET